MIENTTTVRGETVDEAVYKGLKELGIKKEEAEIHIISEGKKGLFGFGKQDAIVEVRRKTDLTLSEITDNLEEKVQLENQKDKETSKIKEGSEENLVVKEISEEKEIKNNDEKDESVEEEISVEEDGMTLQEATDEVGKYLESIIEAYGADSTVTSELTKNQVIFHIETDKTGLIIGKHGRIINSLQTLAQVLFQSLYRKRTSILLNIGDYRDRRATVLEQMAERAAKRVLQTRRPAYLDPLPAYERKQIHAYLAKNYDVRTHSEGKEPSRYLVVDLKDRN